MSTQTQQPTQDVSTLVDRVEEAGQRLQSALLDMVNATGQLTAAEKSRAESAAAAHLVRSAAGLTPQARLEALRKLRDSEAATVAGDRINDYMTACVAVHHAGREFDSACGDLHVAGTDALYEPDLSDQAGGAS